MNPQLLKSILLFNFLVYRQYFETFDFQNIHRFNKEAFHGFVTLFYVILWDTLSLMWWPTYSWNEYKSDMKPM